MVKNHRSECLLGEIIHQFKDGGCKKRCVGKSAVPMEVATGFPAELPLLGEHAAEVTQGIGAVGKAALCAEGKIIKNAGAMGVAHRLQRFTLPDRIQLLVYHTIHRLHTMRIKIAGEYLPCTA
jgi:hypothetical protein